MATILSLDIETIPDEAQLAYRIQHPEEFCRRKDRDDWSDDANDKAYQKKLVAFQRPERHVKDCSIDPLYGRVCSVAAWDGARGGTLTLPEFDNDEARLLRELWSSLAGADGIVTCNGTSFDLPYLQTRSVILGVEVTKNFDTPRYRFWPHFDVQRFFDQWAPEKREGKGLKNLCRVLGVQCAGKEGGMDGSQVYDYVQAGRWDEVAAYNLSDTQATFEVFVRIRRAGLVPAFESGGHVAGRK